MVIQIHRPIDLPASSSNFIANQVAILTTGNVLDLASEKSKIDAKTIKESLVIEALKDTDLVRLTAYNDDAALAKLTVESLVESYSELRKQEWQNQAAEALETLNRELEEQADLIQERRKTLSSLIGSYGIPYFDTPNSKAIGQTEEAMYRTAQEKLDQLEQSSDQLNIAARKLSETPREDLIRVSAGLELSENQVTAYYTAYRAAEERSHALKASGLGNKHPEVVAAGAKAEKALETAGMEVLVLKEVLKTRINLVDKQIEKMKQIAQDKGDQSVDLSMRQHQYNIAKEEYEQARLMYREMSAKQQEQRVLLKMPRTPVTIHESAK